MLGIFYQRLQGFQDGERHLRGQMPLCPRSHLGLTGQRTGLGEGAAKSEGRRLSADRCRRQHGHRARKGAPRVLREHVLEESSWDFCLNIVLSAQFPLTVCYFIFSSGFPLG